MAHLITRLAAKEIYNQPLLTHTDQLKEIVDYIDKRGDADFTVAQSIQKKFNQGLLTEGDIAEIDLEGPLTYKSTGWEGLCGGMSYERLISMTQEAADKGFKNLVLAVDSGGGSAYGCFETASEMREIADEAGMKIIAYVDGMSASAAYAICCISDVVIMNPDSQAGSVGVVTHLVDSSKAREKSGLKDVFVYAGESKIPYDASGGFSEDFIKDLQARVDELYEGFLSHVSTARGLEKEAVRSTQAKIFSAEKALEIGFVDEIMTRSQFANYLADISENGDEMSLIDSLKFKNKEDKENMKQEDFEKSLEQAVADKDAALSDLETKKEELSQMLDQLDSTKAQLEEVKSELNSLVEQNEKASLEARRTSLSEFIPDDKLDSVFSAVKDLPEEAFGVVLDSYKVKQEALESTQDFQELGAEAEEEKSADEASQVMSIIKSKKAK